LPAGDTLGELDDSFGSPEVGDDLTRSIAVGPFAAIIAVDDDLRRVRTSWCGEACHPLRTRPRRSNCGTRQMTWTPSAPGRVASAICGSTSRFHTIAGGAGDGRRGGYSCRGRRSEVLSAGWAPSTAGDPADPVPDEKGACMNVEVETTIRRPRDEVFAAFIDIPQAAQRITGIERVEPLADRPFSVGYRWRETRTVFGKEVTEEMQITQVELGERYRVESDSRGTRFASDVTFEDAEPGATRVRMTFAGHAMSMAARLIAPLGFLFAGSARRNLQRDLDDMRASLEGS